MNMVEDESEVFEITDFTTASEWERFIAKLEELIHEWKLTQLAITSPLTKDELTTGSWSEKSTNVQFADFSFTVTRHLLQQKNDSNPSSSSFAAAAAAAAAAVVDPPKSNAVAMDEDDHTTIPLIWQDMMCSENSFPSRAHCLCRWFGLRDFIVLSSSPGMDEIMSESRINMLTSSLSIAAINTGCQIPIFVQFHSRWRRLFSGVSEFPGFRTSFEMVHLKNTPQPSSHLSGLLDIFKAKIASPISPLPAASVAVRMTYVLQDWTQYSWPQLPPDFDYLTGDIGVTEFGELPFGAYEDPVCELHLSTTWPNLSEEMIVENDVYSDLNPVQSPDWSVRVKMADNPQCLLGDYLNGFVKFCSRKESTQQLLGKSVVSLNDKTDVDVSEALQRLTEPGRPRILPSLGKAVKRATSKLAIKPEEAPIPVDLLNEILLFLFPDAKEGGVKSGGGDESLSSSAAAVTDDSKTTTAAAADVDHQMMASQREEIPGFQFKEMFRQLKSAPIRSLTSRLAVCMCIIHNSHGGLRAVAHLWQEFVLEMRYRWENNYTIPDLESGNPNMGCCLLHQKLQMLNCCIERKKLREPVLAIDEGSSLLPPPSSSSFSSLPSSAANKEMSISSDEEFYECSEEEEEEKDKKTEKEGDEAGSMNSFIEQTGSMYSSLEQQQTNDNTMTYEAEGRLKKDDNDLRLLNNSNELLYIPMTQEPSPMTEDLLEEHAEVLSKLGTSPEGAHLRARMQSACLLSDMEAFKAANPGCILGDFVRWYSPRDWIEEKIVDEDGSFNLVGQLSQRMQIPGNMWLEVWQNARPMPARRQRRLFDDTKEAEKVLHWLAALKPSEVAIRLMPMIVHSAITKLMQQDKCRLPILTKMMSQIINKGTKATRSSLTEVKRYEDLIRHISSAEAVVTRAQSLLNKLQHEKQDLHLHDSDLEEFVSDLLEHPEVNIKGGSHSPLGSIVHRLFLNSYKADIASAIVTEDVGYMEKKSLNGKSMEFPRPVGKEYILRMFVNRPSPWSRPSPQRMYCVLMKDDFRLAGAFTSDTTFQ